MLEVTGWGYANQLPLHTQIKSTTDKRQEFRFVKVTDNYSSTSNVHFAILTRSSGEHRAITVSSSDLTDGIGIIQSTINTNSVLSTQVWQLYRLNAPWEGTYGQYLGTQEPIGYNVYVDKAVQQYFSVSDVQACLALWNAKYNCCWIN
ncbi:MAG: hypothetical protein IJ043_04195 [Clostridia bacterium]|nr:hypothetical protein [Clostridia bacterium]